MKLEQIALIIVVIGALAYVGMMFFGVAASGLPLWPFFIVAALAAWIMGRIIMQRLNNKEDDYYEKNIEE